MEFTRSFAILVAVVLAVIGTSGPGYPTHEERRPDQIKTSPSGLKYVADLDPGFLSICGSCPYQVNDAPVFVSVDDASRRLAKAYLRETLNRTRLINDVVGGVAVLALHHPSSGEVKFFRRSVRNTEGLVFEMRDRKIVDKQTATVWNLDGVAESGPLKGRRLEPIVSIPAFWFAWVTFYPKSELLK